MNRRVLLSSLTLSLALTAASAQDKAAIKPKREGRA
jgi:hypothetical protein